MFTHIAGHLSGLRKAPTLPRLRRRVSLPFMIYSLPLFSPKIIFLLSCGLRYVVNMRDCLLAAVVSSNRRDAWDDAPAAVDRDIPSKNAAKKRARRAWTELLMFFKSVCRQNKRGQRRGQAIAFTRSLLTPWKMGERG